MCTCVLLHIYCRCVLMCLSLLAVQDLVICDCEQLAVSSRSTTVVVVEQLVLAVVIIVTVPIKPESL